MSESVELDRPVFDFYPEGLPPLMSDRLRSVMEQGLEAGKHVAKIHEDLADERARQFRDDPAYRARVREEIEAAGVTAIDVTLLSTGRRAPQGWSGVLDDIRRWQTCIDAADWLSKARTPEELRSDGVNMLFGIQDTVAIEDDLDRLDALYDFGVRVAQLTYNSRNRVGDGCTERTDGGLSEFGLKVVERLNELGMVVDLSHCGEATTADGIEHTDVPPAFTHAFCRSRNDHPRGKRDEKIKALAEADGYMGIVAVPFFLGGSADIEAMIDHLEHAVDILGPDRVGVGTDWGYWTPDVPEPLREGIEEMFRGLGFRGEHAVTVGDGIPPMDAYSDWSAIPEAMHDRGYTEAEIRGFCGENFAQYFETVTTA
ncbi:MAG: dipeptidase [Halobacteriales archaeon]